MEPPDALPSQQARIPRLMIHDDHARRLQLHVADWGTIAEVIVLFTVLILLLFSLYLLITLARKFSRPRPKLIKPDPLFKNFAAGQNWNWDWVMVFRVQDGQEIVTRYQEQHSLRRIVERLDAGGLETKLYKSHDYSKILCKIRCSLGRLKTAAASSDYPLLLDEQEVIKRLKRGYRDEFGNFKWLGRDHLEKAAGKRPGRYEYFEYIYGKYDKRPDLQSAYVTYPTSNSIFRGVDRLKLIMGIMEADLKQEGCSLLCNELVAKGACLAIYPLHDEEELQALMNEWLTDFAMPWGQPIDAVKDYFGEKVGMYFLFLGSYSTWLIGAASVGILVYVAAIFENEVTIYSDLFMAIFMSLWATFFLQSWKASQETAKMEWGMAGFEELERERASFEGKLIHSPVTGLPEQYFPVSEKFTRVLLSYLQITLYLLYVLTLNAGIFYANAYISRYPYQNIFALSIFPKAWNMPQILTNITLAAFIQINNEFFMPMASYLNSKENHRTDTQYDDNLIAKVFLFQFINSYGSLFYVALLQGVVPEHIGLYAEPWRTTRFDCKPLCFTAVGELLGTIFIVRVVFGNMNEVIVPYFRLRRQQLQRLVGGVDAGEYENPFEATSMRKRQVSPAEEQFEKAPYDNISLFNDYAELVIQYGYVTLFVSAFPIAPLFASINNIIEIRVDGWKLVHNNRRPWPTGAEDIGTWEDVLSIVSVIASISNIAMVTMTSPLFKSRPIWERLVIFIFLESFLVGTKVVLSAYLDEIPEDVQMQNERQDFYARKIILNERDEDPDKEVAKDIDDFDEPNVHSSDPQIVVPEQELEEGADADGREQGEV